MISLATQPVPLISSFPTSHPQAVVPEEALEAALAGDPSRPGYLDSGFRLVLAVNKADLLPSAVTRTRLEVRIKPWALVHDLQQLHPCSLLCL